MRAALLIVLLLAGCAAPAPAPDAQEGPLDLTPSLGTLLVDLVDRRATVLTQKEGLAWMSPSGALLTWTDLNFATLLDRASGAREVAPIVAWSRIHDDGTGLVLAPGVAQTRALLTGAHVTNASLPPTPDGGRAWTDASADLTVLAGEYPRAGAPPCQHEIVILAPEVERATGCHVHVAPDGRVGWTEGGGIRVRDVNGSTRLLATSQPGGAPGAEHVTYENPVFTANGTLYLRLRGVDGLDATEVLDESGAVVASLDGPRRLALLDVSSDGRWLLARTFDV